MTPNENLKTYSLKETAHYKIYGRTDESQYPLPLFFNGSGIEVTVTGSELWIDLEVDYEVHEPWIWTALNGSFMSRQMLMPGSYSLCLFRGMTPDVVKNFKLFRELQAMSEDNVCHLLIRGFRTDGAFLPVQERQFKLEFIGDSITSGEGLFGAKQEQDWIPMFFSAIRSYAYLTAKKLDAEYRVFSQSGWGVHSTWDNNTRGALPKYYKEICSLMQSEENERLGGNQPHDFASWQPDFVVVNLGTNDAASFDQPEFVDQYTKESHKMRREPDGTYRKEDMRSFQRAVKDFLALIRACNPGANIIWCYGMLGIDLQLYICEAVSAYARETGDSKVSYLQLPDTTSESVGSREHPGYLCHKQAAEVLAGYITKFL